MIDLKKSIKGFGWNTLSQAYKVLFSSIILIIIARLIPVEDFGIIGMTTVFVLFFNTILNVGFDTSIIYSKGFKKEHLFSLFVLNIGFGLILFFLGYISSSWISLFYKSVEVEDVFRVLIFSTLLSSVGIVPKGYLERKLMFKMIAFVEITSVTISGIVATFLALKGYGYWSIVAQQLLLVGLCSIGFLILGIKQTFSNLNFYYSVVLEHFNFGYNVLLFNTLNFFARQLDILLIGRFLGEAETGIYFLAFNLVLKPISLLVHAFNKTIFPILSRLEISQISKYYTNLSLIFFLTLAPIIVICISFAQIVIPVLLTEKWIETLPLLVVFGYQALRTLIASPSGLLFLLVGEPKMQWKYSLIISIPLRVAGVYLGYYIFKSAIGIAIGINVFATIEMFLGFIITFRLIGLNFSSYFKNYKLELLLVLILIFALVLLNISITNYINLIVLKIILIVSFLIYYIKRILLIISKYLIN